jgi:hypothetical protein
MGFFSWLLCSILVVALVLLLFPFSVRIEFEAGERGARALFFFFKKKVYEYEKKWGKEQVGSRKSEVESEENVKASTKDKKSDDTQSSATTPVKSETKSSEKKEQTVESPEKTKSVETESVEAVAKVPEAPKEKKTADVKDAAKSETDNPKPALVSEPISAETASETEPKAESAKSEKKPKKEKRKLSDREFWTILLTPDLDARAFRYVLKILGAVFSLFRIRFKDCYVEGIQTDYQTMGYLAATNGILKAFPYVGDWDLRMDWCREKELCAAGTVRLSITLLRIFCFVLETLVLAGILAFSFWRRRARVIKTNELPELGFVRKKILNIILED